ncbi:hypothetical protein RHOSPDRAFT_33148 [Rhodotorula sp. JG-1b]|nr:hypothetical protein RHOSPDRAFT_33148 [Rhodotorula sp. JG-1b]
MSAPYGYDRERRGGGLVGGDVGSAADPPRAGFPGPRQLDRSIHGGMELAMEQKLRLDSTDSEFGCDDGSIEPGSPVPGGAQPIPTRPGLARVQSSFTSYSSRSPASRTTSVTSLYDSLGSSAPRTNSAESVPRQSTLKTQMIPPGRTSHSVTAPEDSLPGRPRAPRSASSSSDAYYLPGAPSYPLAQPPRRPGFPGSSYSAHPLLETSYGQGGYLPVPNNPVHWAGPGYESAPYPPPPPQYYHVHPAGQAPVQPTYVLGYPAQNGYPTGLVATSDGHYVQLVAPQPYGVPIPPPPQQVYSQQPVYQQELHRHPAGYPRPPYSDGPYAPSALQRRPSGHAGSDASSPSSYQPGYHLPNLSPHILDPHYASPPSTETSPGTGPVSPFETTQTQVAYPISAGRSMSSDRISLDRQQIPSGGHPPPQGAPLLSPSASVHESGPAVDPAFAFARSALVTSVPSELLAEDAQQVGPSPMERRYATRSGYPSSHMAPHPVVGNGLVPPPPPPMGMAEMGSPSGLPLPPPPPPPSSTARHGWVPPRVGGGRARKDLPRPPTHSLHALWVGNVPSDASHAELWQFFKTRPTPAECGLVAVPGDEAADLESNGVESIHLITRSNCAFVNYITNLHLHHSIAVTNGVTLRPDDTRAKPLVCRVRKAEDDSKSGVGAQRLGGLHTAFVRAQQLKMQQEQRALREKSPLPALEISVSLDKGLSDKRRKSNVSLNSSSASIGSASTTSSFLARHFERRYFILKSHDISELQKSVETGMWATQPHNEPVLQQAYKTARSVYLLFGANGAGSWFGYARMAGPIGNGGGTSSSHSTRSLGSSAGGRSATSVEHRLTYPDTTIMEENENGTSSSEATPPVPPHVFSPSENRWLDVSPTGITPTTTATATPSSAGVEVSGGSAPATLAGVPASVRRAMSQEQERVALETAERLHLPPDVADQARKSVTYDPQMREPSPPVSPEQPSIKVEDIDETLPPETPSPGEDAFVNAAEARNARLDKIETARDRASSVSTEKKSNATVRTESGSTPFAIEWIQVRTLPFARTRHIRNSFNGNREVKISRDGTEIEPAAGELVLNEFWRREPGSRTEIPMRPSSPQPIWNGSGHHNPSSSRESETDEDRTPPGHGKAGGAGASNRASEPPLRSPAMASPPPNEGRNETI